MKYQIIKLLEYRLRNLLAKPYFYVKTSYSQEGEDLILDKIFNKKNNGFYIDIGAFHPYKYSNTQKLYEKGWSGINIEPNKDNIILFKNIRKRDQNLNLAASDKNENINYYKFDDPALNTFSEDIYKQIIKTKQTKLYQIIKYKLVDINNIFNKYVKNINVDLINIDCEGFSFRILKRIDLHKYSPYVIIVEREDIGNRITMDSNITHYMSKYDYILYSSTSLSFIFKKNADLY